MSNTTSVETIRSDRSAARAALAVFEAQKTALAPLAERGVPGIKSLHRRLVRAVNTLTAVVSWHDAALLASLEGEPLPPAPQFGRDKDDPEEGEGAEASGGEGSEATPPAAEATEATSGGGESAGGSSRKRGRRAHAEA